MTSVLRLDLGILQWRISTSNHSPHTEPLWILLCFEFTTVRFPTYFALDSTCLWKWLRNKNADRHKWSEWSGGGWEQRGHTPPLLQTPLLKKRSWKMLIFPPSPTPRVSATTLKWFASKGFQQSARKVRNVNRRNERCFAVTMICFSFLSHLLSPFTPWKCDYHPCNYFTSLKCRTSDIKIKSPLQCFQWEQVNFK